MTCSPWFTARTESNWPAQHLMAGVDGQVRGKLAQGLPGAQTNAARPIIRTKCLRISPTGRSWAAATTEGLLIYSMDNLIFDPTDLDVDVTPEAINGVLVERAAADSEMRGGRRRLCDQWCCLQRFTFIPWRCTCAVSGEDTSFGVLTEQSSRRPGSSCPLSSPYLAAKTASKNDYLLRYPN
ncbi:hypothetical protein SELMODRAFT_407380 [Selaginella moellendorffii]|uniref:Uncharacterized protein n=1 Tax=Selaginella moellendorffii TaxID=88036 RepID=D8R5E9_SELML|nr:hypothetical protein SELMODRAFT_407380 [Selaginella moellendorffii]